MPAWAAPDDARPGPVSLASLPCLVRQHRWLRPAASPTLQAALSSPTAGLAGVGEGEGALPSRALSGRERNLHSALPPPPRVFSSSRTRPARGAPARSLAPCYPSPDRCCMRWM